MPTLKLAEAWVEGLFAGDPDNWQDGSLVIDRELFRELRGKRLLEQAGIKFEHQEQF